MEETGMIPELPIRTAGEITIFRDGQRFGPYSIAVAKSYLKAGQLLLDDLAWKPGMDQWIPLGSMPEFQTAPGTQIPAPPHPPPRRPGQAIVGSGFPRQSAAASAETLLAKIARLRYAGIIILYYLLAGSFPNSLTTTLVLLTFLAAATFGRMRNAGLPTKAALFGSSWLVIVPVACGIIASGGSEVAIKVSRLVLFGFGYASMGAVAACLIPQTSYFPFRILDRPGKLVAWVIAALAAGVITTQLFSDHPVPMP